MSNEVQISLRMPKDVIKRADRLLPRLQQVPEFSAGRQSRAAVLRLALLRGLDELERRHLQRGTGGKRTIERGETLLHAPRKA